MCDYLIRELITLECSSFLIYITFSLLKQFKENYRDLLAVHMKTSSICEPSITKFERKECKMHFLMRMFYPR